MRLFFITILFAGLCSATATIDGASPFYPTASYFSSAYPLFVRGAKTSFMTFDGKNRKLFFPANDIPVIMISPGKTLRMQNVTLVGFRPTHVNLQSPSSQFLFGPGVCWELESDLDFSRTMTVVGSLTVQGRGNVLAFADSKSLKVVDKASLELKNCKIKGVGDFVDASGQQATSIMCADSARLLLNNVACLLDTSWTFSSGSLDVVGNSMFKGIQKTFTYSSGANLTVNVHSSLTLTRGMTFQYASSAGSNKMLLTNQSSQLFFDGASFLCGASGLTLTSGQLFLKGDVPFTTASPDQTNGFILDDSLLTVILNNSSLLVDGVVAHGQPA